MKRRTDRLFRVASALLVNVIFSAEALAHGDLHTRIESKAAEIRAKPASAELYLERGELYRVHEEWPKALADFERAEKLDPQLSAVALARGRLHLARRDYRDATKEVDRFLSKFPKHPQALGVKARALAGLRKFTEAAEAWRLVIEAVPTPDVEHYYERAVALASADPKQIDAALRVIDDGLAKLGNVPSLGLYGVDLEVDRKRFDAALERLGKCMPKTGRKETWREKRADILAIAGRKDEARAEYAKALEEIEALPPRNRGTKAAVALEQRLKEKAKR